MRALTAPALVLVLCLFGLTPATAQRPPGPGPGAPPAQAKRDAGKPPASEVESLSREDHIVESAHVVTIDGREVRYTAHAGTLTLRAEDGKARANVFFIAYTRDGIADPSQRPVTFSFNGGPGSSSVWLHLGTLGPKRVLMDDQGLPLAPPAALVNNEFSILDVSDLVFIDPVSTGFSRAADGQDAKQFHGLREDVEAVGEFIRLYLARHQRWTSPKFLIGESYGTTRAAGLSNHLQQQHGIYWNGIMLVSSILNFQTARFERGNDLPFALFLPTYTATAWYHKKLAPELQADLRKTLDEAERFAMNDYTLALMKGNRLTAAERADIAARVARYTGLSPQYVEETNLRVEIMRFTKELLRDRRQTVGRLDSRFTGTDHDAAGERFEFDPSMSAIRGPYSAAINDYLRRDLKYESDLSYEVLTGRVRPWSYREYENRYVNVAETLRQAMNENPHLKVLVANGYYDLATPYFATEYTFAHMGFEPGIHDRVRMTYYESGHMMYIHLPSLRQLKRDIAAFVRDASAPATRPSPEPSAAMR
jgi:carboxypeptidase C (cathepsin A)